MLATVKFLHSFDRGIGRGEFDRGDALHLAGIDVLGYVALDDGATVLKGIINVIIAGAVAEAFHEDAARLCAREASSYVDWCTHRRWCIERLRLSHSSLSS